MLSFEHFDVHTKIARGGIHAGVTKHFLHRSEIASILQQVSGERGAQQVRVLALPWPTLGTALQALPTSPTAKTLPCIPVNDLPKAAAIPERLSCARNKEAGRLPRARLPANANPALYESDQLGRNGDYTVISALTCQHHNGVVWPNGPELKSNNLSSTQACFIRQAHHHVVAVPNQGVDGRNGKEMADLLLREVSRKPGRCSPGRRQQQGYVRCEKQGTCAEEITITPMAK